MNRKELMQRLAQRRLEVEDILELARTGSKADVAHLNLIARNLTARDGEVPYPNWICAVSSYLDGGYPALLRHGSTLCELPFVLEVLKELRTVDAAGVLADLVGVHSGCALSGELALEFTSAK